MGVRDLKEFFKKETYFKDGIDKEIIQFKLSDGGEYRNGLVKVLMKELITLVYVEYGVINEKTFTAFEALKYFNIFKYDNKYIDVMYSTTLPVGSTFYIKHPDYETFALFQRLSDDSIRFINMDGKGDYDIKYVEVDDILNGKVLGEVWERT
jgi:hypothetical protein